MNEAVCLHSGSNLYQFPHANSEIANDDDESPGASGRAGFDYHSHAGLGP